MISLALAALFFVGLHLLVAGTRIRERFVAVLGELGYMGAFSLAATVGIVWLCMAWAASPPAAPQWSLAFLRPVVLVLMLLAFVFVVVGLTTPSPTVTGGEGQLEGDEPARGILRITRHPFLWGVAIWGVCHVAMNPDAPSLLFFGSLLGLAGLGPLSIDAKRRRKHGERWDRFAAVTSNVPFAAIVAGRNRLAVGELGGWRIVLAVVLYAAFLAAHPMLFGASPF
ncbi:MAG: NnrU family protein [Myxococcota bacterium]|nr:NnrU family protein [Myxococcota bacterium]